MSQHDSGSVGVSIRAVSKRYGRNIALDDVSLDIRPGEFVSLLGPSGSGKTTLLGALGGFVMPSSGTVHIGDRDVTWMPPHKRDIGVVFQSYALFPHMSVGDNVAFPLRARRQLKSGWADKVKRALAMVELDGYQDRSIAQLSGGQRQRVALARAIVFEPRLILMDEPLSALDKQLRETMQIELRQLHKKLGATVIYVTHDQREALTMSDRIAILKDGRLVQVDAPQTLYDSPQDAFVASFIGDSTLLPVTRLDDHHVQLGSQRLACARAVPNEARLYLAVQTEKLLIDTGNQLDEAYNRLEASVREIVYQGDSLRLFLELGDGSTVSLRQPGHHFGQQQIPPVGASLTVVLHSADTVVVSDLQKRTANAA
ncbi:MAG: ABC transporter ATP-binding protein [Salinicola sp.]|uniref:ABC transporter ATP-binding protein n=1 Tax=Salinicola sp. TaxID=1978524 RepID=UPI001DD535AD|nr:ABC transporter ATP-binding protein [Salinicola sp.]NRB55080.1 ABC transporter ATP-binding protein [Salinicola sp.]